MYAPPYAHFLQCIASTTVDEYRTHFENDKALARRFQPVLINEPSQVDFKYTLSFIFVYGAICFPSLI
jgi:ATP-dependent Clp protease ATP-binding subunit ClpA